VSRLLSAAALLDWSAQSLFGLAGVLRRCCEEPEDVPAEMHEELRQSLLAVARERDEARAALDGWRPAIDALHEQLARSWQPWPPLVRDSRPVMTGVVGWCRTTADADWAGEHRVYRELTADAAAEKDGQGA
jgi:hypothetical protein